MTDSNFAIIAVMVMLYETYQNISQLELLDKVEEHLNLKNLQSSEKTVKIA